VVIPTLTFSAAEVANNDKVLAPHECAQLLAINLCFGKITLHRYLQLVHTGKTTRTRSRGSKRTDTK